MVIGSVEIVAMFHQFSSQRPHGLIFLAAVSAWHYHDSVKAEVSRGESLGLSMVAAGRGDHTFGLGMRAP